MLKTLSMDCSIVITSANKNHITVILDQSAYINKASESFEYIFTCEVLEKDIKPTIQINPNILHIATFRKKKTIWLILRRN